MSCQIVAGKGASMKTLKQNGLAILGAKDGQFPKRAISLLELMREFIGHNVFQWDSMIELLQEQTEKRARGALVSKEAAKRLKHNFDIYFGDDCKISEMGWKGMEGRIEHIRFLFDLIIKPTQKFIKGRGITFEGINLAFFDLKMAFLSELDDRKFVMTEKNKSKFLEHENLFGKHVSNSFPSASDEIKAAGNCLALDLNTAAMFHLMRAAELGMRALARHLRVKCKKKHY